MRRWCKAHNKDVLGFIAEMRRKIQAI